MTENVPKANLAAALAKANAEIHNPKFDKENPHFRSKFASLAAVRDAVVPHYAKHGLSVLQDLQNVAEGVACFTTLLHESGEEKTFGPLVISSTKRDGQGTAAAGTYAKRIQLQAVACVVGDDDDDGEAAAGRTTGSNDLKPKGVTTVDPRGETAGTSDPAIVAKWVKKVADSLASENPVAAIYAIHTELAPDDVLYIDVADAIAKDGLCSKGKWKELVRAGNQSSARGKAA